MKISQQNSVRYIQNIIPLGPTENDVLQETVKFAMCREGCNIQLILHYTIQSATSFEFTTYFSFEQ